MTTPRHLRLSDLAHIAAETSRLAVELGRPCGCGRERCTIGEHVWRSTRDARPGVPAQNLESAHAGGHSDGLGTAFLPDREGQAHAEFVESAWQLYAAVEVLGRLIENWTPERRDKLSDGTAPDDIWCSWHLQLIGTREPRYSGDQCRWCYDFRRQNDMMPPKELLEARHSGKRITSAMVSDIKRLQKVKRLKRRRKARK